METELIFEGVPTSRLLDQIARARGWDPSTYAPRQEELDRMCQLATHALERAWHFGFWPQLTLTRSVTYRPSWTEAALPYPLGEQVYWKGRYWECTSPEGTSLEPGKAEEPGWIFVELTEEETAELTQHAVDAGKEPGALSIADGYLYFGTYPAAQVRIDDGIAVATYGDAALSRLYGQTVATWNDGGREDWTPCERTMVCGISYVRYGIEEMDLLRGVYTLNPDRRADARPLPAARVAFGAVVQREPGRPFVPEPWIRFRPYPPRLSATPWDDETAYPKGSLVMHGGESWEAWIDAPAGEEPGESSQYWAPRRCPRLFEDYVVRAAAAELQTDDNARGRGLQAADADLLRLYNNFTRQVNQPGRAMTRCFR